MLGLVKTTLVDFPGEVAATVFTPGCNLRCPYCHNPELVAPPYPVSLMPIDEVHLFLRKRAPVLGGVCITGGEPLLYAPSPAGSNSGGDGPGGLADFIVFCKSLGLKVKLDTNGCFPRRLAPFLRGPGGDGVSGGGPLLDYIAMDIKTVPENYGRVGAPSPAPSSPATDSATEDDAAAGPSAPGDSKIAAAIRKSIEMIISSGIPHEFRTVMVPGIAGPEDVNGIAKLLKTFYERRHLTGRPGAKGTYYLTGFRPAVTLNPEYRNITPFAREILENCAAGIKETGVPCELRSGGEK